MTTLRNKSADWVMYYISGWGKGCDTSFIRITKQLPLSGPEASTYWSTFMLSLICTSKTLMRLSHKSIKLITFTFYVKFMLCFLIKQHFYKSYPNLFYGTSWHLVRNIRYGNYVNLIRFFMNIDLMLRKNRYKICIIKY